ncbi:MAG: hypothetical protein AAF694_14950 [Bacteroidota bacterium]
MASNASQSSFYVGYLPKMPVSIRRFILPWILFLLVLVSAFAYLLVQGQKGFSSGTFELGKLTTLEGDLLTSPVPMLRVYSPQDKASRQASQEILLIGFGKNGAQQDIAVWEEQAGHSLERHRVQLSGTLIYYNGKTLLELTEGKRSLGMIMEEKTPIEGLKAEGPVSLVGEIIDPKCYFGVMKPGHGKAHRSCASLCVAGGIPPVFRVENEGGNIQYYFLLQEGNVGLNQSVKPFISEAVSIQGTMQSRNNWNYLYIADLTNIQRLNN